MALLQGLRGLGILSGVRNGTGAREVLSALSASSSRAFASEALPSRKDVLYLLDNRDDPDVDAAVKAYLKAQYKNPKAEAPASADDALELTARVEKKYYAAQVVEYGLQNVGVPLAWDQSGSTAPVKRYVAQLHALGTQAGFESPAAEVEKRLADAAQTAETVKELLGRIKPYTSAEYHAALSEALLAVEAETNSTVTTDGSSAGYKKFAERVKAVASANKIPWKVLVDAKKASAANEDATDKSQRDYNNWLQTASVADATAEIDTLKAEATALLDKHLSKPVDQIRKEQASSLAALIKKVDQAKGAAWAAHFKQDLTSVEWFDSTVARNPAVGPQATA